MSSPPTPAVAEGLAPLGLAFIDVLNAHPAGELVQHIRRTGGAPLIVNTGFATEPPRMRPRPSSPTDGRMPSPSADP